MKLILILALAWLVWSKGRKLAAKLWLRCVAPAARRAEASARAAAAADASSENFEPLSREQARQVRGAGGSSQ